MASRRLVYQQGDHVCTLYSSKEEQLAAAVEYIIGGLSRGEQCLYVCGEHTPAELREALQTAGVDVKAAEARGALSIVTKEDAHLKGGAFDPDKMISMLRNAVKDALAAGFTGLAAAGDMSWVLDGAPGTERVAEYESRLNAFYANNKALGLCQYNRKTIPEPFLDHCIATHPVIRIEDAGSLKNPFYEPPEKAIGRTPEVSHRVRRKMKDIFAQVQGRSARAAAARRGHK